MAKSTAPILILGGVTITSRWLELVELNGASFAPTFFTTQEFWKPAVATGLAAGAFALLEKVNQPLTVGLAWVALVTTLLVVGGPSGGKMNIFDRITDVQNHPEKYVRLSCLLLRNSLWGLSVSHLRLRWCSLSGRLRRLSIRLLVSCVVRSTPLWVMRSRCIMGKDIQKALAWGIGLGLGFAVAGMALGLFKRL